MSRIKKFLVYLFILVLFGLGIVIYVVPGLTGVLTKTTIIPYGNLQITDSVLCYFIRDEVVYGAAKGGKINYYIGDETLLRKGAGILSLEAGGKAQSTETDENGEGKGGEDTNPYMSIVDRLGESLIIPDSYTCKSGGTVSYFIDGYENYFTIGGMENIKHSEVKELKPEVVNMVREHTEPGEPLYKLYGKGNWYLLSWVNPGSISKYTVGKMVTVKLPEGDIRAQIYSITEDGDLWRIIFKTNRYYAGLGKTRAALATVVTSDYSGLLIDNSSITTSSGAVGVYVRAKNGDFVFKPVKVLTTDGEVSLVEADYYYDKDGNRVDTVKTYDEILRNPSESK